jgi:adenylosuccinate lyase
MNNLLNISPIDGRYSSKTQLLNKIFSEYGFIKYRLFVELNYLIFLSDNTTLFTLNTQQKTDLLTIYNQFTLDEANEIKNIEKKINHDVKSIEYYIKTKIEQMLPTLNIKNFVHFGLTSQDINCPANMLMIRDGNKELINSLGHILTDLNSKINMWKDTIIITRTHGQIASPSTIGKELNVFKERLENQLKTLTNTDYRSKFGGAVGNFNAHKYSNKNNEFYDKDWDTFGKDFLNMLELNRNKYTTQIDHYDNYSEIFNNIQRINTILIDLCQDIWLYISYDYFKLKINKEEVGSSTMPHKVNPIDFENAEGNLLLANTLLQFMSNKLPVSRLQRDLTDSTILRNLGTAYGHVLIAFNSVINGLKKLDANYTKIKQDLESNYVLVSEGIQTRLKVLGIEDSYENIKNITRSNVDTNSLKTSLKEYINGLPITEDEKYYLCHITPANYNGIS